MPVVNFVAPTTPHLSVCVGGGEGGEGRHTVLGRIPLALASASASASVSAKNVLSALFLEYPLEYFDDT